MGRATHRQVMRARQLAARAAVLATAVDVLIRETRRSGASVEDLATARRTCDDVAFTLDHWVRTHETTGRD